MKSVLFVMNAFGLAGAERALISLLRSFDYEKYEVSFMSIIDRGEMFSEIPKEVKILNENPSVKSALSPEGTLYIMRMVLKRMLRGGYIFKYIPYAIKNIAGQLKKGRFQIDKLLWLLLAETTPPPEKEYDLAVAYIEGAATYYVAERVKAKKKISFVHINYEKAGYNKKLDNKYYGKMDGVFCVSEAVVEAFRKTFPEYAHKIRLFYNIVIHDDIIQAAKLPGGFTDGFDGVRILSMGRLHPQKGLDIAIPAFARLVGEGYENVRWYVLGDGPEKPRLTAMIEKHGLEGKFILLGSSPAPYPYIKQCDIYVQPSRYEGLCIALQEALILGRPAITTDFDGIPDLLENGVNGIVITLSEENIASALKILLDSPEKRAGLSEATKTLDLNLSGDINEIYSII